MPKLLPGINEYLEQINDNKPVTAKGLEDLVYKIIVHTGLSYTTCEAIVKEYFQLIRNEMLNGNIVYIQDIGKLYIQCPKNGTSKKKIMPLIKPFKKMKNWLKYVQSEE